MATLIPSPQRDADRAALQAIEDRLAARERELDTLKTELQTLQERYLREVGTMYAELATLESAVAEIEIRLGLREPPAETDDPSSGAAGAVDDGCSHRPAPSADLKRVFRDVARAIHPDLARDDAARFRRHSLMAEANRAYSEQDADRLLLILHAWSHDPEAIDDLHLDEETRLRRRLAAAEATLAAVEAEFAELRGSAIYRLKQKIDETRRQGWDLFGEIVMQVKTEVSRANARLRSLQLKTTIRG
jgi:hypothetical protein